MFFMLDPRSVSKLKPPISTWTQQKCVHSHREHYVPLFSPGFHSVTDQLTSDQLTSDQLTSDQLTSDQLTSDQLTSDQLSSDQLTSDQLTSDQLTSDQLTSDQLTSDQLTSDQPSAVFNTLVRAVDVHEAFIFRLNIPPPL